MKTRLLNQAFSFTATLILTIALTLTATPRALASSFPDLPDDSPRAQAINYLTTNHVVQGYGDGTFKPTRYLSRAELTKIIVTSQPGISEDEINYYFETNYASKQGFTYAQFKDVPLNAWYAKYIVYAYSHGWAVGYPDMTFRPNQNVNMVEALKLISESNQIQAQLGTTQYLIKKYPSWYAPYLFTAFEKKIFATAEYGAIAFTFMDRINTLMYPGTIVTRENAAEMLYRVMRMRENGSECYSPDSYEWQPYSDSNLGFSLLMPFPAYQVTHGQKFEWNWNTPVGITSRREVKFAMKSFDNPLATPAFTVMTYTVRDPNLSIEDFAQALEMDNENLELRTRTYQYYSTSSPNSLKYSSQLLNDPRMLTSHGEIFKQGNTFFHVFSLDWHAPCDFEKVLDSFNFRNTDIENR